MLSPDTPETNSVTVDGVTVSKWRAAERFSSRTVVYYLKSSRDAPVSVRIADDIPEGLAAEDLMFHPTHGGESWSSTDSEIVFEEELEPEGELTTICRVQGHDPEPMEALLDAEMDVTVDPALEAVDETATETTEEAIEATEPAAESADTEAAEGATLSPPSTEADWTADTGSGDQRESAPAPVETALGAVEDDGESFSGAGSASETDTSTADAEASDSDVSEAITPRDPATESDPTPTSPMTRETETPREADLAEDIARSMGDAGGPADTGSEETMAPDPEQTADSGDSAEATMAPASEAEPEPADTATKADAPTEADTSTEADTAAETEMASESEGAAESDSQSSLVDIAREIEAGDVSETEREVLKGIFGSELRESNSLDARIRHLQTEIADLKAYTDALEEFLDEEGSGSHLIDRLEGEFEALAEDFDSLSADFESLSGTIEELEAEVADHDDSISALDAEQAAMEDRVDGLSGDLSAVRQDLASVDSQMQRLETRLDEGDILRRFAELERQIEDLHEWKAQMRELFT